MDPGQTWLDREEGPAPVVIFCDTSNEYLVSEDFQCYPKQLTKCVFLLFAGTFNILNDTWSDVRLRLKNHIEGIWKSKSGDYFIGWLIFLPDREVSPCFGGPETKWRGAQNAVWAKQLGFTQVAKKMQCNNARVKKRKLWVAIRSPPKIRIPSTSDKISVSCLHGEGFASQRCVCELTGPKEENGGNLDLVHGCRTEILQKFGE